MSWKKVAIITVWTIALLCWASLPIFYFNDASTTVWTIVVTATALATEVAFWVTAATLGLTVWESRQKVLMFLTRPFRRSKGLGS